MQKVFEATFRSEAAKLGLLGSAGNGSAGGSASVPTSMPVSDDEDLPVRRPAASRRSRVKDDSEDEYAGSD